tara:strand:+ start:8007 stop:8912 length:906 start_codon:yes stop_codon:yes gene_type:complete
VILAAVLVMVQQPRTTPPEHAHGAHVLVLVVANTASAAVESVVGFCEACKVPDRISFGVRVLDAPLSDVATRARRKMLENLRVTPAHAASIEISPAHQCQWVDPHDFVVLHRNRDTDSAPRKPTVGWDSAVVDALRALGDRAAVGASPLGEPAFPKLALQNDKPTIRWEAFSRRPSMPLPAICISTLGFVATRRKDADQLFLTALETDPLRKQDVDISGALIQAGIRLHVSGALACLCDSYDCDLPNGSQYANRLRRKRTSFVGLSEIASSLEARFKLGPRDSQIEHVDNLLASFTAERLE